MNRKAARDWLIQMFYQMDIRNELSEEFFERLLANIVDTLPENNLAYIKFVSKTCFENMSKVDEIIAAYLKDWTIDRINRVDLAILRVAVVELKFMQDIPESVTVKEAVDLSRKYGDEESAGFVNGVLGQISS